MFWKKTTHVLNTANSEKLAIKYKLSNASGER